jgi:outer membrane receptor protein involved in Fe transport
MKEMRKTIGLFLTLAIVILFSVQFIYAQTTGKIAGKVTDRDTGDPLPGTNVVIEGTTMGAATGLEGEFFIINVPPGLYTLKMSMIGYEAVRYENVRISVNRTTEVEVQMKPTVLEGEEVVIQAEKIAIKKDQTSSFRNVSSDQIDILPVESMNAVVTMQAGVVNGHFRGGRYNEVAYLIDGIDITESFGSSGRAVEIEPESIRDLEVITGTFNAEYGKAMSGIVNAVTKDGGRKFHGSISAALANYFTPNKDIFIGLKNSELDRNQDYKFQLDGPVWSDKITFFANIRYQDNKNHLNGVRRFNVDDFSYFSADDPNMWYSEHNGDSAYVPMSRAKTLSVMGKLTFKLSNTLRTSLMYTLNDDEWHNYGDYFGYKYNPDGQPASYRETKMYSLQVNHMLSSKLFYELKLSYMDNYNGLYLYKNPTDSRYIHDAYLNNAGPGFYTGGQYKQHGEHIFKDLSGKFDLTWQATKRHALKTGFLYVHHDLDREWYDIRNKYEGTEEEAEYIFDFEKMKIYFPNYEPVIYPNFSVYTDSFRVKPYEFSSYLQDKMEFNEMVINLGVRYDYFNPNAVYPSQLRNPANQLDLPDSMMSTYPKAKAQIQISPRFGLSYQLGKTALLHFSYGHFFQMPPMYAMYQNRSFQVSPRDYATQTGNPQIKAQKTVQYEIGLWQELMDGMGLEVALFYRDIYDLLSARVITTFNQIEYGLYSNIDYGNAKGLEVKYDFVRGSFSAYLNYTLQYTRGNADNPTYTFNRAGESKDPVNRLIAMSWDQRHTLNLTLGYNKKNYGVTLTGYYNSGAPYTWSPIEESTLSRVNLYPNNSWRPTRYTVDLNSFYDIAVRGDMKLRVTLTVYNLLDRLNEEWVNATTGRAYTAIIRPTDIAGHRSDFNEFIDTIQNPSAYSSPRLVKLEMGLVF